MNEEKKKENERIYEELAGTDNEAAEANMEIQDEFHSDEKTTDPASSPVPYVTNNTAPIFTESGKEKKR